MKLRVHLDRATPGSLAERLKKAQSRPERQRIQCVFIRATSGSTVALKGNICGGIGYPVIVSVIPMVD